MITLEEHYISSISQTAVTQDVWAKFPPRIVEKLKNLNSERIRDMDSGGVTKQVLSHGPLEAEPTTCSKANDECAQAISRHPDRFAGFALLPMAHPIEAAAELERCVKTHNFVGTLIDAHCEGEYYDDEKFWPVFAKAEQLDVPVYIHPTFATENMLEHYKGNYSEDVALALSAFGWGWHVETGLCILRMYASGLFDRYPRVKIIIGHMGELLPFQLDRTYRQIGRWGNHQKSFKDVWEQNIWVTTSGMFSLPSLQCLLRTTSIEHVLYSVDYPFSTNEQGMEFVEQVRKSGMMTEAELQKWTKGNAEKLLRL